MHHGLSENHRRMLEDLERLCAQAREAVPGAPVPCFAHLRVETEGRLRELLLGPLSVTRGPVPILNWQTAPLASVFFSSRVGEPYDLEVGERTLEGTVRARSLLDFSGGALSEV